MSTWKGKSRGGLAGYRIFIYLLKNFNLKIAYFILHFVALYFVLFAPKARKPMYYYFNTIIGYGFFKTAYYLYLNNLTFGKVLIDKVVLMAGLTNKFTFSFDGEEHLHDMANNEGGLIIGAHIGNWEIAGHMLDRIKTRVHIVILDAEHRRIKALLDNVMTNKNMNFITINDDMSHLFQIKEALLKNEIVAIHGDRFLPGSKTISCNFLGKNAKFPTGPFYIAMKYKKPVTFVSAVKQPNKHYHLTATQAKLYENSNNIKKRDEVLKQMIVDYVEQLQITLYNHPEQWYNYYYFWETKQLKI
ncbi:MAG: lipid A biosynthesis acyltransferase [Bacteroidetes bacterium]|nr:lipid A biosynthesis acyltransferase [Bacteroidota bacterium]MBL6944137.1 lipid A biosynthesis acyltransferase [Bacteroidales bacterium]